MLVLQAALTAWTQGMRVSVWDLWAYFKSLPVPLH